MYMSEYGPTINYEESFLFLINRTAKALIHTVDQMLRAKVGITYGQWRVITVLFKKANSEEGKNKGLTQREIASNIGIEDSTVIPIIDKLQKDGLVSRQPDRNDRRNNRIVLTENSDKIIQDVITYGEKLKNVILSNISQDELSITKKTLDKMWDNVQSKIQQELLFARMDGAEMPQRMNRSRIDG
ncbi:MarR family transcriptional regulator [Candidatus Nitrosocosmicus sp. SS]|nr:MarR family transcriptional regulator [Candidatus Nitrosocosmicus sp. SS]KAF0869805.1 MarR family transcriptional regulator [Candidatus Nitrosocosmicus sp. SS]